MYQITLYRKPPLKKLSVMFGQAIKKKYGKDTKYLVALVILISQKACITLSKYFFSTSYPDKKEGDEDMDVDEEVEGPATLEGDEFQLVLPSGVTVGHRTLMR